MSPAQIADAVCVVLVMAKVAVYAVLVAIHDTFECLYCALYACPVQLHIEMCIFGRQVCRSAYDATTQSAGTGGMHNACGKAVRVQYSICDVC